MAFFAKVLAVHPEAMAVDVRLDDGRQLAGVPVLSQSASMDSGSRDLPDPTDNTVLAVVDFVAGDRPLVLGFLFPRGNACAFTDNRAFNVHHSGAYYTVTAAADMEVFHPSGAFVRIASDVGHEDLSQKDYQGLFKVGKNTGRSVSIVLGFADQKVQMVLADSGITVTGNVTVSGDMTVSGTVTASKDVVANKVSLHDHVHGDDDGGETSVPVVA